MSKMVHSSQDIDVDMIWEQLDRVFCMLPSFCAVMFVNKSWSEVVLKMRRDWASALRSMNLSVAPRANPSPRTFARLLGMVIDDKYLEKFAQPVCASCLSSLPMARVGSRGGMSTETEFH
jgi:hypothetical protein